MKHLIFLDRGAGELEKILSGIKTMLIQDLASAQHAEQPVNPGDRLYFLRDTDEGFVRVTATVVSVLPVTNDPYEDLSQFLKEMQPRLQLTEEQYNHWSGKGKVLLVEFGSAQKIGVIHVALEKATDRSDWIPFDDLSLITE